MEASKPNDEEYGKENAVYSIYTKARTWVSAFLGLLITVAGILIILFVASLEGTKEVQASNSESGKILNIWRELNPLDEDGFPEEKADVVLYDEKEYYFIIAERDPETDAIVDWYFAFDGGFGYIFKDYKFYVLTGLTIVLAMYISYINYVSSVRTAMNTLTFGKTMEYYKEKKKRVEKHTQYIPAFCIDKNKQTYDDTKRDIIEEADINYDFYTSKEFDPNKLDKWQRDKLEDIKFIRVKRIHAADLLQEHTKHTRRTIFTPHIKVSLLPMGQKEHQTRFLVSGGVQKVLSSILSGMVIAFGVKFGNWALGATYAVTLLMSYVSAVLAGTDFVNTTLRNRFLAKADLLNEFDNTKELYVIAAAKQNAALNELLKKEEADKKAAADLVLKKEAEKKAAEEAAKNPVVLEPVREIIRPLVVEPAKM